MVDKPEVMEALKTVIDPELGIDIVSLGLIYDVRVDYGKNKKAAVEVEMTLTSMGCPLAPVIEGMVKEAVGKLPGVGEVSLELVWDPPWSLELMSEEAKAELGL